MTTDESSAKRPGPQRLQLSDLKTVARELKERLAREALQIKLAQAKALKAALEADAGRLLFMQTVGAVKPLPVNHRSQALPKAASVAPVAPIAKQRIKDQAQVLHESLSDEMDVETLLETDSNLSYRQPNIGEDVLRKLRRGVWSVQGEIDLHGLRSEEARLALSTFVREASNVGWRCVRVVHGKGLGSVGKIPVLKAKVQRWLVQKSEVLAFVQARAAEGGAGALVVLLA